MIVTTAPRWACTIELAEVVIVTGGSESPSLVTVYSAQGWVEDWPSLTHGRADHACGHFVNTDSQLVRRVGCVWTLHHHGDIGRCI